MLLLLTVPVPTYNLLLARLIPPIVPLSAFKRPPSVTLKGAELNAALPSCIPTPVSALNTLLPVPTVILFVIVALFVSRFNALTKLALTLSAEISPAIIFAPAIVPSTTKSPVVKLVISAKAEPFHL